MAVAIADRFGRGAFQAVRRIELPSWHLVSAKQSPFLRELTNDLLRSLSPGLAIKPGDHQFLSDRYYWLGRLSIPGPVDVGLATVLRRPHSARLVLSVFNPDAKEPILLYQLDRVCLNGAAQPARIGTALDIAYQATASGFEGAGLGL
eukprot:CAMPEP_0204107618 /NCGR_PEP_ID=MMETSP0361-20130328/232_1 /ASSEMBLY_ACC=CAM_ASM_000343 /TAXON_ID=268821 /ORGANISM="Scrippsiella Hangoei, Strain SHTV-5" /LENGTH=147 /DNA_ID=CAMNT_0051057115 /DNA_START=81 /DNA_END=524 /DNA_ORIENTATION=+